MAAELVLDSKVKINGVNPIQGSVSLSPDESNMSVARYEGGAIAGMKGEPEFQLSWQTFGKSDNSKSFTSIKMITDTDTTGITIKGIYTASCSWSSDWGFITEHKVTGVRE